MILLLATLLASCAANHNPEPQRPIDMLSSDSSKLESRVLGNGLTVVAREDHKVPLATILIAVRAGAFVEDESLNGLSHLYEHMFFKGNRAIPTQEAYMQRVRELGMSFNGTTSTEQVLYHFTLPSKNLEAGLQFMYDAITSPLFDQVELEKERMVVLSEYDRNESSPYFYLGQRMDSALFPDYTSRKNVIGDRSIIESATQEKMLTLKERYFIPNNSALVVTGDINTKEVMEKIAKMYSGWEEHLDPNQAWPVPKHPVLKESSEIIVQRPFQNAIVAIGWHGPSVGVDDESTYAADVFSYILSQRNSNFQKNLVDSGIFLGAGLSYYTQRNIGPIMLQGTTTPKKLEQAKKALADEIEKFDSLDYFSDKELEQAKLKLAVNELYDKESSLGFARSLGFWWSVSSLDYLQNYIENLQKVDRAAIFRYINRYIKGHNKVVAILKAPPKKPVPIIQPTAEQEGGAK